MFAFPAALAPPPPFPVVTSLVVRSAAVAPGVADATYWLRTADGPLVVHLVAVDPRAPHLHLGTVLAGDRMISAGETVSAMAARTGAIAGVNADYFDIGQTNQPLNVVVSGGRLLRTPSQRAALLVARDGSVRFSTVGFRGTVRYGTTELALTGVNEFPPQGGATLLGPAFGSVRPAPGVKLAMLAALDSNSVLDGEYRVTALVDPSTPFDVNAPMLGFGPAALGRAAPPGQGDVVHIATALDPPLDSLAAAVGGGPFLIAAGAAADDPHAPAPEERNRRFPVSGAATLPDGTLLLLAADGGNSAISIGLTRPQFGALMLGFGATDGMAFDSGGSATLVARESGTARALPVNVPSDGRERRVADGLFVYSEARGGAQTVVLRPDDFLALPGAVVSVQAALVDAGGNFVRSLGTALVRADPQPGRHSVVPEFDALRGHNPSPAALTYRTVASAAALTIESDNANPDPGAAVHLVARVAERSGAPIEAGGAVTWRADAGSITSGGFYRAPAHDATVSANAGGLSATYLVRVGHRERPLPPFAQQAAARWSFAAAPREAPGAIAFGPAGELRLAYDFTGNERAAYANAALVLPGEPLAISLEVEGDGSGAGLRAAFLNKFGERRALTLARTIDWHGWKRLTLALPRDLNPPVTLASLYVVPALGGTAVHAAGSIGFRALAAVEPGSS